MKEGEDKADANYSTFYDVRHNNPVCLVRDYRHCRKPEFRNRWGDHLEICSWMKEEPMVDELFILGELAMRRMVENDIGRTLY